MKLTDHQEDHDRDEWLALTRFLQPINPDPVTKISSELASSARRRSKTEAASSAAPSATTTPPVRTTSEDTP